MVSGGSDRSQGMACRFDHQSCPVPGRLLDLTEKKYGLEKRPAASCTFKKSSQAALAWDQHLHVLRKILLTRIPKT